MIVHSKIQNTKYKIMFYTEDGGPSTFETTLIRIPNGRKNRKIVTHKSGSRNLINTYVSFAVDNPEANCWDVISEGYAYQSPLDEYNPRIGKKIALKRAMEGVRKADLPKVVRKEIWERFDEEFGGFV